MAEHIQVVQPAYSGSDDEQDAATLAFWSYVASNPDMVVIVEPISIDSGGLTTEGCEVSIFSTYAKAMEHAKALTCHGAIIVPKMLNEPSWGNVAVN